MALQKITAEEMPNQEQKQSDDPESLIDAVIADFFEEARSSLDAGCKEIADKAWREGTSTDDISNKLVLLCQTMVSRCSAEMRSYVHERWPDWKASPCIEERIMAHLDRAIQCWISEAAAAEPNSAEERSYPCKLKGANKRGMVQSRSKRRS